jgi:uncharacterized damage-inducible protein DinB
MLDKILDHQRWADFRTLESLRQVAAPKEARSVFGHIIGAETIWADRIAGLPQSSPVWPVLDLDTTAEVLEALHDRFAAYCRTDLSRIVKYTNSDGVHFETSVADILTHIALHGAYHRGQVAHLLRSGNVEPQPTDYIQFVRGAPAAKNQ